VLPTIELDNDLFLQAYEVDDEHPQDMLTANLESIEATRAQQTP